MRRTWLSFISHTVHWHLRSHSHSHKITIHRILFALRARERSLNSQKPKKKAATNPKALKWALDDWSRKLHLIQQTTELSQALRSHFTTTHLNSLQTRGSFLWISFWVNVHWSFLGTLLLDDCYQFCFTVCSTFSQAQNRAQFKDGKNSQRCAVLRIFHRPIIILTHGIWSWISWNLELISHHQRWISCQKCNILHIKIPRIRQVPSQTIRSIVRSLLHFYFSREYKSSFRWTFFRQLMPIAIIISINISRCNDFERSSWQISSDW